jgi:hypothetical protein
MHSTFAFTAQGLPLGVLEQQIWARPEPAPSTRRAKPRPIAEKESHKWLAALRESLTMTPSDVRLITVAESFADIFEFLAEAADLEADSVIRAAQDRRMAGEVGQLWAHMQTQAVAGQVTLELAARPGKPAGMAELRVRVAQVTLQPPRRPADDPGIWLEPLTVWAIWLHEDTPPGDTEPRLDHRGRRGRTTCCDRGC